MSKCECKECIHEKVCRTREFPSIEEILKDGCPHYKDKSLFVELPCKVGGMKRFVKHFYTCYGELSVEEQINKYVEENNLNIITMSCMYGNGIYVLFEESEDEE